MGLRTGMLDITRAHSLNFLFPQSDSAVGKALKHHGEFAPAELDLLSAYLDWAGPAGTFLDIGANIGALCLPLARTRPRWKIVAVEGHRGLAQVLSANAFANGLHNVEVVHAAVGATEGLMDFPSPPLTSSGNFGTIGLHMDASETTRTMVLTLDSLAPASTTVIKIDVEGHESEVLKGASRTLEQTRPILLLEATPKHEKSNREVRHALAKSGYDLFWFYSPFARLTDLPKAGDVAPPNIGDAGVLALPPGAPNLWDLRPIASPDEAWPLSKSVYPYLARYGF